MKTKTLGIVTLTSIMGVGAGVLLSNGKTNLNALLGEGTIYNLALNSENALAVGASGTYSIDTSNGNAIEMAYTGATTSGGAYHIALADGGTLKNTTMITGVGSLTIKYTAVDADATLNLTLVAAPGQEAYKSVHGAVVSEQVITLDDTYNGFELVANGALIINSIAIEYSCANRFETENKVRYEAESTFTFHTDYSYWDEKAGADKTFIKYDSGASGGSYIGDLYDWVMSAGSYKFNHYAYRAGNYTLRIRYGAGTAENGMGLTVNGNDYSFAWGATPGWFPANFANKDITISLQEGWNHIDLGNIPNNWYHLDYFEIIPEEGYWIDASAAQSGQTNFFIEAENTNFFGNTTTCWHENGRSCGNAAGFGDVDATGGFEIKTYSMVAGQYDLVASIYNGGAARNANLWVNGDFEAVEIDPHASWEEEVLSVVTLADGVNTISLGRNGAWCNFDYFKLVPHSA